MNIYLWVLVPSYITIFIKNKAVGTYVYVFVLACVLVCVHACVRVKQPQLTFVLLSADAYSLSVLLSTQFRQYTYL